MKENDMIASVISRALKDTLPSSISPGDYILDLGANQGLVTLPLAKLFPEQIIKSFEPVRVNYDLLRDNLAKNNIQNVETNFFGFGPKNGKFEMCVKHFDRYELGNTGTYTMFYDKGSKEDNDSKVFVELRTFDDYLKKNIDMCQKIVAMKIDIEGCEKFVLNDDNLTLLKKIKFITYECVKKKMENTEYGKEHQDIFKIITNHGFKEIITKNKRYNSMNRSFIR